MSSSPAPGYGQAPNDALLQLAESLSEAHQRETYAALVAYVHSLDPADELVKIAQLFGFLTLMGRELPVQLTEEQVKLAALLAGAQAAFEKQVEINAEYCDKLQARLEELPTEIAQGVKPEAIAKTVSESFRQQILKVGLQDTQALLSASAKELKTTTKALDDAIQPLRDRYQDLAANVEPQTARLQNEANQLVRTADTIQNKNSELLQEVASLQWWWLLAITLLLVALGVFVGVSWEKSTTNEGILTVQQQIQQLQQQVGNLQKANIPPAKPQKKK